MTYRSRKPPSIYMSPRIFESPLYARPLCSVITIALMHPVRIWLQSFWNISDAYLKIEVSNATKLPVEYARAARHGRYSD